MLVKSDRFECYPHIEFETMGNAITARLTFTGTEYSEAHYIFTLPMVSEELADATCKALCKEMSDAIREAKKAAYDLGVKHGRSGRKRLNALDDFYADLDNRPEQTSCRR